MQLPVYYLSLGRLFPIGETGKTKNVDIHLTEEENTYFVKTYKELLSIQESKNAVAAMEKADARRNFVGVNDNTHDAVSYTHLLVKLETERLQTSSLRLEY